MNPQEPKAVICILGNDGCGKSTLCGLLNQTKKYLCVERSLPTLQEESLEKLRQQIKRIDQLTYKYAFEDDWYNFDLDHEVQINGKNLHVFWILLTAPVETLRKRINSRLDMTVYQHQKCINYFNYVYEEMAYFYGINLVNSDQPIQKTLSDIYEIVQTTKISLSIKNLTLQTLNKYQLQNNIISKISKQQAQIIYQQKFLIDTKNNGMEKFYFPALYDLVEDIQSKEKGDQSKSIEVKKRIAGRWIKNNAQRKFVQNKLTLTYKFMCLKQQKQKQNVVTLQQYPYLFQHIIQGQSKIIYKVLFTNSSLTNNFRDKIIILLKSTIYSHTNQCTAQISELGKIRAKGSMIFLQMLKRNNIKHSYICLNKDGIILSKLVETNALEIVFKKECLGTDKHSFVGLRDCKSICGPKGEYNGGIYIRFDWRNPNHYLITAPSITLNLDPYYYIIQKQAGKQKFFKKYLNPETCKAVGDKCITQDLVTPYVNTTKIKQKAIEAYCTFQYYAHAVGLEILDGCMMIDQKCDYIWSEINPDCLRVKSIKERQDYDKDIWRAGGSASKQTIMKKWQTFNDIFISYFQQNRFMKSQMSQQLMCKQLYAKQVLSQGNIRPNYRHFYQTLSRPSHPRKLISTIDLINGQPILVQSSQFSETHSNQNIREALQYISIMPQVLLVDIDGACGKEKNNKELMKAIRREYSHVNIFGVGGGIRDIGTAEGYLQGFENIVISSNLDIIDQIPIQSRNRIVVQLSVNQKNQILTHGRTVNTGIQLTHKLLQLCKKYIRTVSITFNCTQGKLQGLPRQQLRSIMNEIPGPIKKVIIAGGISNMDDLQFVWGFEKCVPQLGSAIWKKRIALADIYSAIVKFSADGLVPAVLRDQFGGQLGLVYLNEEALRKCCEERYLYRFSRQHNKLMKKGQQSGNTQKILSICPDCNNNSLVITICSQKYPQVFCHNNTRSCFQNQHSTTKSLQQLQQHILKSKSDPNKGSGYSHKVQNNPKLAISKVMEEVDELALAESHGRRVQEFADVLAHLLMFGNAVGLNVTEAMAVLDQRSRKVLKANKQNHNMDEKVINQQVTQIKQKQQLILQQSSKQNLIKIGIAAGKHNQFIHNFIIQHLGVKILPHIKGKQRNYTINYEVVDKEKYQSILNLENQATKGEKKIVFISVKPKDLGKFMQKNYIKYGINYSNIIQNSCQESKIHKTHKIPGLKLALLKRKGEQINPQNWSPSNKAKIISEYPQNTTKYLSSLSVPSSNYSLIRVSGHSEGFLEDSQFVYCDAVVCSGKTVQDNNLEIQAVLQSEISVCLFQIKQ